MTGRDAVREIDGEVRCRTRLAARYELSTKARRKFIAMHRSCK